MSDFPLNKTTYYHKMNGNINMDSTITGSEENSKDGTTYKNRLAYFEGFFLFLKRWI